MSIMSILQDCMHCLQPVGQQEWQDCRTAPLHARTTSLPIFCLVYRLHASAYAWKLWAETLLSPQSGKVPRLNSPCRLILSIRLQAGCWAYVASLSPAPSMHHSIARYVVIRRESRDCDYSHAISTRLCPSVCPWPTSSSASDPPASWVACSK